MDKRIKIFLIVTAIITAGVVIYDMLSTHIANRSENPFEYNVDEYKDTKPDQVSYLEKRQITISDSEPKALTWNNGKLYLLSEGILRIINAEGGELFKIALPEKALDIAVAPDEIIYVIFDNYLVAYDTSGKELFKSTPLGEKSLFTAVTLMEGQIFVADAGEKMVQVFNSKLEHTGGFKGESGVSAVHGFILPGNRFDLATNKNNELWVVNPGLHIVQNYSAEGRLRGYWGTPSFAEDGFSGCCNPSFIEFLSDGRVVTSEKGIIRVKLHKESGEFESMVAPAAKFEKGEKAPALAVDDKDNIWLLDFDTKKLRLFVPITATAVSS